MSLLAGETRLFAICGLETRARAQPKKGMEVLVHGSDIAPCFLLAAALNLTAKIELSKGGSTHCRPLGTSRQPTTFSPPR